MILITSASGNDALLDLQRLYREGKAATVTRDVEQILGREPIGFAQFSSDYRYAFQAPEQLRTEGKGYAAPSNSADIP